MHSIRSLLCTTTNATPHERFFGFRRRSALGTSMPTWLNKPGPVYVRRHIRSSKHDPLVDEVELLHATPNYAQVRFPSGRESTVPVRDIAPFVNENVISNDISLNENAPLNTPGVSTFDSPCNLSDVVNSPPSIVNSPEPVTPINNETTPSTSYSPDPITLINNEITESPSSTEIPSPYNSIEPSVPRRSSTRVRRAPDRFEIFNVDQYC